MITFLLSIFPRISDLTIHTVPDYHCGGHKLAEIYGKPFYYLFYKSDIWFNISDILYNI